MKTVRKLTLTIAGTALAIYSTGLVQGDEVPAPPAPAVSSGEWTMEIIPAAKLAAPGTPVIQQTSASGEATTVSPADYAQVYQSIPFRRSEYNANPNYRHDSAMEILTGNARHQTIVNHNFEHKQPVKPNPPAALPSRLLMPWTGWNYVPGWRGFFGNGWVF